MTEVETLRAEVTRLRGWLSMRVEERLADHLRSLAHERDGQLVVVQPPSTEALGRAIGARRESVTRAFTRWRQAGLVEIRRPGNSTTQRPKGITLRPALFEAMQLLGEQGRFER